LLPRVVNKDVHHSVTRNVSTVRIQSLLSTKDGTRKSSNNNEVVMAHDAYTDSIREQRPIRTSPKYLQMLLFVPWQQCYELSYVTIMRPFDFRI